jgi:predicted HicB family RNase H-like nuclease
MSVLTYKGYQASVEYEDGHIVIQLLHIEDLISTSCDDAQKVEDEFHSLVEDYLATCIELGREPKKPYKGSLNIRMSPNLHYEVATAAASAGQSINAWIVNAIEDRLRSEDEIGKVEIRISASSVEARAINEVFPHLNQPILKEAYGGTAQGIIPIFPIAHTATASRRQAHG